MLRFYAAEFCANSSGVNALIDKAWTSAFIRSPIAPYTNWWRCTKRLPSNSGLTMVAKKVLAIALNLNVGAGYPLLDVVFNLFWGG